MFLSNAFIQAIVSFFVYYTVNEFEVCFCEVQTEFFPLKFVTSLR